MKDFIVGVGRINIDLMYSGLERLPNLGEELYAKDFGVYFGGGIPGEAIILSRLGLPSRAVTWIGKGHFADIARSELENSGAEIIDLYKGEGSGVVLSTAMICGSERTFCSYCEDISIGSDDLQSIYRAHEDAGIILMDVRYANIYRDLASHGAIRIFDTGWGDDLSLDNRKYREMIELADFYLPNRKEALKITGADSVENAAEILSSFFRHTVIKLDHEGCLIKDAEGTRIIPSIPGIIPVDSTGAGDAFLCGFTYGLYHHYSIDDCIRFGNITGGTCVQARGCLTRTLTENELLEAHRRFYS